MCKTQGERVQNEIDLNCPIKYRRADTHTHTHIRRVEGTHRSKQQQQNAHKHNTFDKKENKKINKEVDVYESASGIRQCSEQKGKQSKDRERNRERERERKMKILKNVAILSKM